MALLPIITLPDPRLRIKSSPVTEFTGPAGAELRQLVKDMEETMVWAKGIGLAAVQVAVHKDLLIIDIGDLDETEHFVEGDDESERRLAARRTVSKVEVFINPKIIETEGSQVFEEGCLSVPGVYCNVTRANRIKVEYQDLDGNKRVIEAQGLKAVVLQHEMDHLEGIVFTDRLGPMQRMMVLNKYNKLKVRKKEEEPA